MATKNDHGGEGAEETDAEEAAPAIIVTVPLPKAAVTRIDALASRPSGGPTRAEVLQRHLQIGLDAEEKAAAEEQSTN